jgi:hypothetical protein
VMVLIVALDWPFRGELRISPEAFQAVRESIQPGALRPDDFIVEPRPNEPQK